MDARRAAGRSTVDEKEEHMDTPLDHYAGMSVKQLRAAAKDAGLKSYSKLTKDDLTIALADATFATTEEPEPAPTPKVAKPTAAAFKTYDEALLAGIKRGVVCEHFNLHPRAAHIAQLRLGLLDPTKPMTAYIQKLADRGATEAQPMLQKKVVTTPDVVAEDAAA